MPRAVALITASGKSASAVGIALATYPGQWRVSARTSDYLHGILNNWP